MHQPVPLYWGHLPVTLDGILTTDQFKTCRPNVMEWTVPVFIMLDNIVEIAAEDTAGLQGYMHTLRRDMLF